MRHPHPRVNNSWPQNMGHEFNSERQHLMADVPPATFFYYKNPEIREFVSSGVLKVSNICGVVCSSQKVSFPGPGTPGTLSQTKEGQ